MILSDKDIVKAIRERVINIEPFDKELVQPASIDLRLDSSFLVFDNHEVECIDIRKPRETTRKIEVGVSGAFIIHPGDFILGSTIEKITLPGNITSKIEGRSSLGRVGLMIHATAGYVDPGFSGNLTLEISNIARLPIRLYAGMRIAQISFIQMSSHVERLYGDKLLGSKYQNQSRATSSRIWKDFNGDGSE